MVNMAEVYACSSVGSTLLVYVHSDGDFRETVGNPRTTVTVNDKRCTGGVG